MGEGGCTCKTNCILLLPSSRFVGHQKCNNKECWGRKRDFIQRKNHGNLFAENHDLSLRIHKMFQSSVSFAPHMFITFTRSSYLPDHANHLPEIRKTLNPKWVITVSHQGWYRYIELPGQLKSLSKSEASLLRYEQLNTPLFPSVPALPKMHPHPSRSFVWVWHSALCAQNGWLALPSLPTVQQPELAHFFTFCKDCAVKTQDCSCHQNFIKARVIGNIEILSLNWNQLHLTHLNHYSIYKGKMQ